MCAVPGLAGLLVPLATDHELVLVDLVAEASELRERAAGLAAASDGRTAAFVSNAPGADLARLAAEQDAELLVAGPLAAGELEHLLAAAPCDVAVAPRPELSFEPSAPVVVPFGGAREEWAALELGAWIARAHDLALTLLGTEALEDRRDASRLLRFAGTSAEPVLVPPGAAGILEQPGSLIVASLPALELDRARAELVERTTVPLLLVRGGLRPSGLAPEQTLTRFSWSLEDA